MGTASSGDERRAWAVAMAGLGLVIGWGLRLTVRALLLGLIALIVGHVTSGIDAVRSSPARPRWPRLEATGFWQTLEHPSEGMLRLPGVPAVYSKTPSAIRRLPPRLGEHSAEILREVGLSTAEIEGLLASGATRCAAAP